MLTIAFGHLQKCMCYTYMYTCCQLHKDCSSHVCYLDNRCDELLHKVVSEKTGPVVMEEVDDQSFDV